MNIDIGKGIDSLHDKAKEISEYTHENTKSIHESYVSKVVPDFGKYGDVAKFAAEMVPGVSEYNAIREGDWQAFAISAGIDVASVALCVFTAGTGYAALKGGTTAAKAGAKTIAKTGLRKAAKETVEVSAKKLTKEATEATAKKVAKETTEATARKVTKEVTESGTSKVAKEVTEKAVEKIEKKVLEVGEKIDKTHFKEYLKEIEKITERKIPRKQKELIKKAIKENDYTKLSPEAKRVLKEEYYKNRNDLIKEWEKNTGQKWPRYTEDVLNKWGEVIRHAGDQYDAHHIIELSTNGPNEWWNIHPAAFPNQHQNGIHALGTWASKIFGK